MKLLLAILIIPFLSFPQSDTLMPDTSAIHIKLEKEFSIKTVSFPDIEAHYPGGYIALMRYIRTTIVYPEEALQNYIKGRVYLDFVVKADGSISDVRVSRGVHTSLDNEALRVIQAMPKWMPAMYQGIAVPSRVKLPVIFNLD